MLEEIEILIWQSNITQQGMTFLIRGSEESEIGAFLFTGCQTSMCWAAREGGKGLPPRGGQLMLLQTSTGLHLLQEPGLIGRLVRSGSFRDFYILNALIEPRQRGMRKEEGSVWWCWPTLGGGRALAFVGTSLSRNKWAIPWCMDKAWVSGLWVCRVAQTLVPTETKLLACFSQVSFLELSALCFFLEGELCGCICMVAERWSSMPFVRGSTDQIGEQKWSLFFLWPLMVLFYIYTEGPDFETWLSFLEIFAKWTPSSFSFFVYSVMRQHHIFPCLP